MVVVWPDRTFTTIIHPATDTLIVVQQPAVAGKIYNMPSVKLLKPLLTEVSNTLEKHTENDYIDFYNERNLPEMLSREGPQIAKGDVNADGLDDIFIGGATNQSGQLYIQTEKGFVRKQETAFTQYADFEDVAVLFFDADKDGDLDLFVGSGGNTEHLGSREIQHRLYKNDGKGNFALDSKAFPINSMNIAVAIANDYDGDGDLDLFVGSRSVPMAYGLTPESYLYNNDGQGHFTDVAKSLNENIAHAGMVTGAVWADLDGDSKSELIITGEWMATKIFSWNGKVFKQLENTGLENLSGWWQTVAATDVNNDGKMDLIIGNIGDNFYLRPSMGKPVKMWLRDYDQSGTIDQFITKTVKGKDVPIFLKKEIVDQFPILKKQNLKNIAYAEKSVQELFGEDKMKTATVRVFNYSSSVVAVNNGKGSFQVQPLPVNVQLSSVKAICTADVNSDGKTDLILGGNNFNFPPQFGRVDASYGHLLINIGNAAFRYIDQMESGINVKGETKDIKEVIIKGKKHFLFTQNDGLPVLYQLEK